MHCKDILIVEDDDGIREALRLTLELEDYSVHTANNGKEGLERLNILKSPCLILLDLMMPVMDGWTFIENIKKHVVQAHIPIIVITAFAERTKDLTGTRGIIKKPIDIDLLLGTVKQYCG